MEAQPRAIVVGGGLAGLSTACELLERGCNVTILDKQARFGGNSAKATSGICAPGSSVQKKAGIEGDDFAFLEADAEEVEGASAFLAQGVADLEWLSEVLGFSDELVLRHAPGHSVPRLVGTKEYFPGMVITYKTIQALKLVAQANPDRIKMVFSATVKTLIKDDEGKVVGVEYEQEGTPVVEEASVVIIATGGYAGDSAPDSLLATYRPDLVRLSSTNDERARGDGIVMSKKIGAATEHLNSVHILPLALEKDDTSFVAAETILAAGGILLDGAGNRFCDEMASNNERLEAMMRATGPFRLVIGETAAVRAQWLVDFYVSKGVMSSHTSASHLAKDMQVSDASLRQNLMQYSAAAAAHACDSLDEEAASAHFFSASSKKRHFSGKVMDAEDILIDLDDNMFSAVIKPALYTCGGGLVAADSAVLDEANVPIQGLFAAGEVLSAPSQKLWAMPGVPLLHAIASGRAAGSAAATAMGATAEAKDLKTLIIGGLLDGPEQEVAAEEQKEEQKEEEKKALEEMTTEELIEEIKYLRENGVVAGGGGGEAAPAEEEGPKTFTMAEVAKHNTQADAWVVINDMVIDVTNWIPIHPGGVQAITAFIGQDASDEWNTIHKPGTVEQKSLLENGPIILGKVGNGQAAAKSAGPAAGGIPLSEVAKHNKQGDAWVAINGKVYDVTKWIDVHPGGVQAICAFIGTDASDEWNTIHKPGTVEKNEYPQNNGNGPRFLDVLQGGGGGAAPAAPAEVSEPPPQGEGILGGYAGAFLYMAYNWIRLILKTVFFTGNFKVEAERAGTVRSAMFLVFFIIIHAVGNLEIYLGKDEYNGYAYFYKRLYWTGFGLEANIVEEYLAIALFVHVCVALKRSYDITINYCLHTGRWRMLLTGLCTLFFLINHVQDFRLNETAAMVPIRPPPYYFSFDGALEGRFWFENADSGIEPVMVRDVAGLVLEKFYSFYNVLFYTAFIVLFIVHAWTGWAKLSGSEVFFLPTGHVQKVRQIGQVCILGLGAIYLSFPWVIYLTHFEG